MPRDPRHFQIAALGALLLYGVLALEFAVSLERAAAIIATALAAQFLATRLVLLPAFEARSALITAFSLCLLLRTNSTLLAALAAAVAIGSKFTFRLRGRHLFNPANFALAAMMLATGGRVWVSPGQWGSTAFFGFLLLCAGGLVATRARRADVALAFLLAHAALLTGRALWLGDPMTIPLHALESGALLIFAFFMISDPKTTPATRAGRVLFAVLVALGAYAVRFTLWRSDGIIWSLAALSPLVPLIDWLFCRSPFAKSREETPATTRLPPMKHILALLLAATLAAAPRASAFCGFYVAKADTKLFNKASQVVLVRDENRTVLTMANDYQGDPKDFAVVIPVPTFIEREQIHVGDKAIIDHLDAYSAPRLVEYFDDDPCNPVIAFSAAARGGAGERDGARDKALGVKVEASYTVGEYDIVILSAEQSDGLETWLTENGYKIPEGAAEVLGSYIKQKNRFFVAKVNLEKQSKLGFSYLRPLQIAYESRKFMLPIRLGTVNADGPQELFIYCLTRNGRVETTNYRTVKLPTGGEIPLFVKDEFGDFYRAMFDRQVKKEGMKAVFLEYAWDMGWCDPCAAEPLSPKELRSLGVFWLPRGKDDARGGDSEVFVTRLHVRYDREHFPEDLVFQQTRDKENFQGRYVLRHPWRGPALCKAAERYLANVPKQREQQAETLADLTGWDVRKIRERMKLPAAAAEESDGKWYQKIWKD